MNLLPLQMLLEMFSSCAFSAYFVLIHHVSARNGVHCSGEKVFSMLQLRVRLLKMENSAKYHSGYNKTFLV